MSKTASIASKFGIVVIALVALFSLSAQKADAAAPVLTVSNAGNSQIQIQVQGDVNSSVQLYYYNPPNSGSIQSAGIIGSTNSSGYFTTTVSNTAYGIPVGTSVFVNVNNQQSASVTWPTITGGNVYLSQTSISLSANQNSSVTISGGTGSYYISTNSNSNVATAYISGSTITVSGINGGSTNLTICSASNTYSCATLYVTVNGGSYYNNQTISFNPTSVSVQTGQNQSVNIYGSGSYYLSSNSNSSVASVTINGNLLNIYGITNGSDTMTFCSQTSNSSCASLYVNVYSSYNNGYNGNYYNGTNYNNTSGGYYVNGIYYPYNNSYNYNQQPIVYNTQPVTYTQPVVYTQPTVVQTQSYGQPVTGVYLNQVPATGIDFNLKIFLFVIGLFLWSAAIAYFVLGSRRTNSNARNVSVINDSRLTKAEQFRLNQIQKRGQR